MCGVMENSKKKRNGSNNHALILNQCIDMLCLKT